LTFDKLVNQKVSRSRAKKSCWLLPMYQNLFAQWPQDIYMIYVSPVASEAIYGRHVGWAFRIAWQSRTWNALKTMIPSIVCQWDWFNLRGGRVGRMPRKIQELIINLWGRRQSSLKTEADP